MIYVTMVYGPIAAMLVELFPTRIRYTSMSLPYHIGNGWFGGLLPSFCFAITVQTGNIYNALYYPDRGGDHEPGRRRAVPRARDQGRGHLRPRLSVDETISPKWALSRAHFWHAAGRGRLRGPSFMALFRQMPQRPLRKALFRHCQCTRMGRHRHENNDSAGPPAAEVPAGRRNAGLEGPCFVRWTGRPTTVPALGA